MKRRNADCGKLRRPIKRNKITEGMYGSTTVLYMKFLVLWAIVITADFMFMFRFEFLWPFWLLLRSVHDSFKYKGLAFSVLFVCIAITSDLVCLFFIPVHWLLFAASTYVWVQYVWHTDKGICLPTIILWMLFVYLEAGIRWKDSRHMPHLDLCRPFAAHCIGYPVVTLGFGFKSYVGYRMRQRKQREVAKENEFYMQLLQQALPQEETPDELQSAGAIATTSATAVTTHSGAQNSSHTSTTTSTSSSNGSAVSASTTNAIVTANGILATQAQNHHHQTSSGVDHHTHHNNINNNNNSSSSSNNSSSSHSHNNCSSNNISISTSTSTIAGGIATANSDDKNYVQISGGGGSGGGYGGNSGGNSGGSSATSNGHIGGGGGGGNSKSHRRSVDKDYKNRNSAGGSGNANAGATTNGGSTMENDLKHNSKSNSNHYQQLHADGTSNNINNNNVSNSKDKSTDWDGANYQVHQTHQSQGGKDKNDEHRSGSNSKKSNMHNSSGATTAASAAANGNVLQYDEDVVVVEPVERTKGRRNRSRKDNASKDNHQQHHNNNSNNNNNNNNNNNSHSNSNNTHHVQSGKDATAQNLSHSNSSSNNNNNNNNSNHNNNSDASSVSSSASSSSTSSSSSSSASASASASAASASASMSASSAISNLASKMVSKICESCLKLEADVKKYRSEISHMKQIENELRQKLESNLTTKSCLQAKQKECDELEKRINELTNARHADMLQLQSVERRLTEERRQKQSLDAQLNNEKKARKLAEEKAARPECSAQCKQRKQQIEEEIKQLRRDLKQAEEAKQMAEQHGRKYEQELRMFEAEIRTRDSNQPGTEMLINALAAMQDKNCTLEKNLSAETRVKLDLFSALGDAKRQLEISESRRRSKEDEVHDLKAKIAQLLAVMPTDSLCLPACSSTGASSMLRMNDTPPLQTGPGPASPMLSSLSAQQASAAAAAAAAGHQLNVNARVSQNSATDYVQQAPPDYVGVSNQQQSQCPGVVPVSVATAVLVSGPSGPGSGAGGSNLDPNATVYTPKGGPGNSSGGVVVVGGSGADA